MKILYISHLHPPKNAPLKSIGGMQRVSIQLVSELQKKDDIEIKTLIQHAPWKGIEWRTALFLFKLNTTLPGIVRRFEPDVILYSSMVTASLAAMTRKRISVPMVTINHGQDVKLPVPVYQKFVPKVFKALDGVISVSEATRQECIKRGMDPEKGVALPNGFDLNGMQKKYSKQEAISALEKQFGINLEGKSLLLTVGRQVKRKGHAWFLKEVLPKIQANVIYLAIGEGPEHESLQQLVREQGLEGNVLLVGKQPDLTLQQAYTAADIFVMPNIPVEGDMEGFGIVLLEANIAGTPAVASDLEGIKDVIENGKNGFKNPVYDAEGFAEKIDLVISKHLPEMEISSKKYVEDNFAWNSVAKKYISYLDNVIQRVKS